MMQILKRLKNIYALESLEWVVSRLSYFESVFTLLLTFLKCDSAI